MFKFFGKACLIFFLLAPFGSAAQEKDWRPSAVRVGTDVFGFGKSALQQGYTRQEFQADIDFYKYFLVVDAGRESVDLSDERYMHESTGSFYRIGVDVNFTPYNANRDIFFFGVRYARASFSETLTFGYGVPYWGVSSVTSTNQGISSQWMEGVIGIKVRVWQQLYMGYTVRAQLFNSIKGAGSLVPYQVPGYGVLSSGGSFGFGYHVFYRLAFRDKAIPIKPKGKI